MGYQFTEIFSNIDALKTTGITAVERSTPSASDIQVLIKVPSQLDRIITTHEGEIHQSILQSNSEEKDRSEKEARRRLRNEDIITESDARGSIEELLKHNRENPNFRKYARRFYKYENRIHEQMGLRHGLLAALTELAGTVVRNRDSKLVKILPVVVFNGIVSASTKVTDFASQKAKERLDAKSTKELQKLPRVLGWKVRAPEPSDKYIGGIPHGEDESKIYKKYKLVLTSSLMIFSGIFLAVKLGEAFQVEVAKSVAQGISTQYNTLYETPIQLNMQKAALEQPKIVFDIFHLDKFFTSFFPNSVGSVETRSAEYQDVLNWMRTDGGFGISVEDGNNATLNKIIVFYTYQKNKFPGGRMFTDPYIIVNSKIRSVNEIINKIDNKEIPTTDQFKELILSPFANALKSEKILHPDNAKQIEMQYLLILKATPQEAFINGVKQGLFIESVVIESADKITIKAGRRIALNSNETFITNLQSASSQIGKMSDADLIKLLESYK